MRLRERVCPVCGASGPARVAREARLDESRLDASSFSSRKLPEFMHFRLLRCAGCDCLYASPAPDPEWLGEAYREAHFAAGEESRQAADTYARELRRVLPRLPDRRGALDIGCGDGAFLETLLAEGFEEVVGVEPSRAPVAQAGPAVREHIRRGVFRADAFEPDRWSLVSCFQTLEHVDDPAGLVAAAAKLLAPGGAFLAVAHDHRALPARLLGRRSPIYDVEHLQLFSRRSLRALLEGAGFERVEVTPLRNAYSVAYWVRLSPLPPRIKAGVQRLLGTLGLARRVVALRAGNLVVVGQRPGPGAAART